MDCVFFCFYIFHANQGISNLTAFLFAVTFSFFLNAKFTFNKKPTSMRYILFSTFMGGLSFLIGILADGLSIQPFMTLVFFSSISLILGFVYSKLIVFK